MLIGAVTFVRWIISGHYNIFLDNQLLKFRVYVTAFQLLKSIHENYKLVGQDFQRLESSREQKLGNISLSYTTLRSGMYCCKAHPSCSEQEDPIARNVLWLIDTVNELLNMSIINYRASLWLIVALFVEILLYFTTGLTNMWPSKNASAPSFTWIV
jgi:hypothetical protein